MRNFKLLIILLLALCCSKVQAQTPDFLRRCPYNLSIWPSPLPGTNTCPAAVRPDGTSCPATYRNKPFQDCCGALEIKSVRTNLNSFWSNSPNEFNSNRIVGCGAGCKTSELPSLGSGTCFNVNKRLTTFYSF